MQITEDELRDWSRDFYQALERTQPESLVSRFASTIEKQPKEEFRRVLGEVCNAIATGHVISKTMANYPDVFPEKYVTIVRYGEIYGELDSTLRRFAEHPEDLQSRCGVPRPQTN